MEFSLTAVGPLQRIGFGHCGSVWGTLKPSVPSNHNANGHNNCGVHGHNADADIVIKREDASPGRDIKNEVLVQ
jgi:hypothetical protein